MISKRKILILSILPIIAAGCNKMPRLDWVDKKPVPYSYEVPYERSSVVFYRTEQAIPGDTVNVYINGEYLTSLEPGAYSQETLCSNHQLIYSEFTGSDPSYIRKPEAGVHYDLPPSVISFFRVTNQNGQPVLEPVAAEHAQTELQSLQRQNHTVSRVSNSMQCSKKLRKYSLNAAALFEFDRYTYADMLEKGKQEISAISAEIRNAPGRLERVYVVGYTDPSGSDQYNQALSSARAATVMQTLIGNGIPQNLISAEGRGERDLIIGDCAVRFPRNAAERKRCDLPNRRVEILVQGLRED